MSVVSESCILFRQDSIKNYFLRSSGGFFLMRIIALGISFLTTFLLTQWLDAANYGLYAWNVTWLNVLALLCTLGFDQYLMREVAAKSGSRGSTDHLVVSAKKNVLLFSLTVICICFLSGYFLMQQEAKITAFAITLLTVPFASLILVSQGVFRGKKEIIVSGIPELLFRPFFFLSVILILFAVSGFASASIVLLANFAAYAGAFGLTFFLQSRIKKKEAFEGPQVISNSKKAHFLSGIFFLTLSGAALINTKTDIIMIGLLGKNMDEVGFYHVASNLSLLITFFLGAANTALAPLISDLNTRKEKEKLQRIVSKSVRIIFILTLPLSLILIFFGEPILSFFGTGYVRAYFPLVLLCTGQVFNVACGSVGYILSMTGNEKLVAACMGAGAVTNIILNSVLIPTYGLEGAAVATMAGTITWNMCMVWFCVRKAGIHSTIAGKITL